MNNTNSTKQQAFNQYLQQLTTEQRSIYDGLDGISQAKVFNVFNKYGSNQQQEYLITGRFNNPYYTIAKSYYGKVFRANNKVQVASIITDQIQEMRAHQSNKQDYRQIKLYGYKALKWQIGRNKFISPTDKQQIIQQVLI